MPKGGARVNSGPPPDPNALRRDRASDRDGWTDLPSSGREGDPPGFPLTPLIAVMSEDESSDLMDRGERELEVWGQIWATPQAVAWERLGWINEVALYVRLSVMAEAGDMKAVSEVRQWSDRLGLNPAAMMRNRWRISKDQLAERRTGTAVAKKSAGPSMRDRLQALDGA